MYESCDGHASDSSDEEGGGKGSGGGVARKVLGRKKKKKKKKNVSFKEVLGLGGEGGGLVEALIGDSGDLHTHRMMVRAELHKDNLAEEEKSAIKVRVRVSVRVRIRVRVSQGAAPLPNRRCAP